MFYYNLINFKYLWQNFFIKCLLLQNKLLEILVLAFMIIIRFNENIMEAHKQKIRLDINEWYDERYQAFEYIALVSQFELFMFFDFISLLVLFIFLFIIFLPFMYNNIKKISISILKMYIFLEIFNKILFSMKSININPDYMYTSNIIAFISLYFLFIFQFEIYFQKKEELTKTDKDLTYKEDFIQDSQSLNSNEKKIDNQIINNINQNKENNGKENNENILNNKNQIENNKFNIKFSNQVKVPIVTHFNFYITIFISICMLNFLKIISMNIYFYIIISSLLIYDFLNKKILSKNLIFYIDKLNLKLMKYFKTIYYFMISFLIFYLYLYLHGFFTNKFNMLIIILIHFFYFLIILIQYKKIFDLRLIMHLSLLLSIAYSFIQLAIEINYGMFYLSIVSLFLLIFFIGDKIIDNFISIWNKIIYTVLFINIYFFVFKL